MKQIENECLDCGKSCMGTSCPYNQVTRFYCDQCGCEETLYEFDGEELCIDCIKERLVKVN